MDKTLADAAAAPAGSAGVSLTSVKKIGKANQFHRPLLREVMVEMAVKAAKEAQVPVLAAGTIYIGSLADILTIELSGGTGGIGGDGGAGGAGGSGGSGKHIWKRWCRRQRW